MRNIATHRLYIADITTSSCTTCATSGSVSWNFYSNCSVFDSSSLQQTYCNSDNSISTITASFTPSGSGVTVSESYTDVNIGDLGYIYIESSSSDGWGMDKVTFLMNDATNERRTCSFGDVMGILFFDGDCSGEGAFQSITFDIVSSDSIC